MEIQKRRSNKHKKGCDWGYWDYIWDNCGVLTLKKGIEEECEEIAMENSEQIVGQEGERKGENILAQHRQKRCQKQIKERKNKGILPTNKSCATIKIQLRKYISGYQNISSSKSLIWSMTD